jgi:hypothetical protein
MIISRFEQAIMNGSNYLEAVFIILPKTMIVNFLCHKIPPS